MKRLSAALLLTTASLFGQTAFAQGLAFGTTVNNYGMPGLIDMPTGETRDDADLSFTVSSVAGINKYSLAFQVTPRISGSFRYAKIPNWVDEPDRFDRSFDLHFQLFKEQPGSFMPSVAIGLRDFMGTGLFSGQYIVATKSLNPSLKVTAGVGWGRFSGGPQTQRKTTDDPGGVPLFDTWFTGDVGVFGGVEWQTPIQGLSFKAEYSADTYDRENELIGIRTEPTIDIENQLNFALEYQRGPGVSMALYYLHGSEVGVRFSTHLNPKKGLNNRQTERAPIPLRPRPLPYDPDQSWVEISGIGDQARDQLNTILNRDGLAVNGLILEPTQVQLRLENSKIQNWPMAIGRAARALHFVMPDSVNTFVIIPVDKTLGLSAVTINRNNLEDYQNLPDGSERMLAAADISDVQTPYSAFEVEPDRYPRFRWNLAPELRIGLFNPSSPITFNAAARLNARYEVFKGFTISGSIQKNLLGTTDTEPPEAEVLPLVRTDTGVYFQNGDPGISHLTAQYLFKLNPNTYGRVTAGLLESAYGGVSGELLWKPANQNWGLGVEVNYAKKREYDRLFDFQDYDIITGHVSAYFDLQNGYTAQVDAGRYLAGDWGATFALDRVFDNGWKVGAYATFTDVPFKDFGEGSFDKGIRVAIPIGLALGRAAKGEFNVGISSLTRDGGQRLRVQNRLYGIVSQADREALEGSWGTFYQ